MKKLFALALAGVCGAASAQTPATNPMPDGSHDMYIGLGAVVEPVYEGSNETRTSALPVLQFAWSNGVFVSGLSAGIHVSQDPSVEFGPMMSLHAGRTEDGLSRSVGSVGNSNGLQQPGTDIPSKTRMRRIGESRLHGMNDIDQRLEAGFFLNYYLNQRVRLTSSFLGGSGKQRNGARLNLGIQHIATEFAPHHSLTVSAGLTLANRPYIANYFGVTEEEAQFSFNTPYAPAGGLKDVSLAARWNWTFSSSWLLTTGVKVTRLQGDAARSPLIERPTNVTVSTALAYRF
jgi:outer membrane protein